SPRETPRAAFCGDPLGGLYCHPTIVEGVGADDELYRTETFGPIVGVASFATFAEATDPANGHGYGLSGWGATRVGGGDGPGKRARLRAVVVDLHPRSIERVPIPGTDLGRHGEREQLHLGRRGAPAVRRQRQVRERLPSRPPPGGRP